MLKKQYLHMRNNNPNLEKLFFSIKFKNSLSFVENYAKDLKKGADSCLDILSIRAFKLADIYNGFDLPSVCFVSSGTTQNTRAKCLLSQKQLAENLRDSTQAFQEVLKEFNVSPQTPIISLVPHPSEWPQSSLAAMIWGFSQHGIPVHWLPENLFEKPMENLQNELRQSLQKAWQQSQSNDLIFFGTSIHHLMLFKLLQNSSWQWPLQLETLIIFDTGGTKGRTFAYTQNQMNTILRQFYANCSADLILASEYGMCELASQAYSFRSHFEGTFRCSPKLGVRAIDLEKMEDCKNGDKGFLCFFDLNNTESYPAIVTEDIGYTLDEKTFVLCGRAPDATTKGCSLQVRDNFAPSLLTPEPVDTQLALQAMDCKVPWGTKEVTWDRILDFLAPVAMGLKEDLARPFLEIHENLTLLQATRAKNLAKASTKLTGYSKQLTIIASANSPVTIMFPAAWAYAYGYTHINIKLPSIRSHDNISHFVRSCVVFLSKALTQLFGEITMDCSGDLPQETSNQDFIVFGTNDTVKHFTKVLGPRMIGFGTVRNAAFQTSYGNKPDAIAKDCTALLGRGCLTPVVLFCPHTTSAADSLNSCELSKKISLTLAAKYQSIPGVEDYKYLHKHDMAELKFRLAELMDASKLKHNLDALIFNETHSCVIDLRNIEEQFNFNSLPFELAGSGVLFLLPEQSYTRLHASLSTYPVSPGLREAHQGIVWTSVFDELARLS